MSISVPAQRRPTRSRRRVCGGRSISAADRHRSTKADAIASARGEPGDLAVIVEVVIDAQRRPTRSRRRVRILVDSVAISDDTAQRRPTRSRRRVHRPACVSCRRGALNEGRRDRVGACHRARVRTFGVSTLAQRRPTRSRRRVVQHGWPGIWQERRSTKADAIASARGALQVAATVHAEHRSTKADAIASARVARSVVGGQPVL